MTDTQTLILIGVVVAVVYFVFLRGGGDIASADARKLVADGALLLDVRTVEEYRARHIDGALNIPLHELQGRLSELPDKQRPIVVYCRSGNRSGQAERLLERAGYPNVHNLGAMTSW